MKTVNYYRIEITGANSGILGASNKFDVTELNVIAENDRYIAVDDFRFTSIRKEGDSSLDSVLNKPSISLHANDHIWGDRISYTLYTNRVRRAFTIKKQIEAAIVKKYGFYLNSVDLSLLDKQSAKVQKDHAK